MYHNLFILSSTEGHLVCSQILAIMNKVTTNIRVQVFVWMDDFSSFGKIPRSTFTGSYSKSMFSSVRQYSKVVAIFAFPTSSI